MYECVRLLLLLHERQHLFCGAFLSIARSLDWFSNFIAHAQHTCEGRRAQSTWLPRLFVEYKLWRRLGSYYMLTPFFALFIIFFLFFDCIIILCFIDLQVCVLCPGIYLVTPPYSPWSVVRRMSSGNAYDPTRRRWQSDTV